MSKQMKRFLSILCAAAMLFGTAFAESADETVEPSAPPAQEQPAPKDTEDASAELSEEDPPAQNPASEEEPAQMPDPDEPAQEPAEQAGDEPVDELAQEPAEQAGDETADEPSQEPAEQAGDEPADEPAQEPAEQAGDEPADEPAQEPAEQAGDEPADEPSQEPAEQAGDEPADEPAQESDGEPAKADAEEYAFPADTTCKVTGDDTEYVCVKQYPNYTCVRLTIRRARHFNLVLESKIDFSVYLVYEPDYDANSQPSYTVSEQGKMTMRWDARKGNYLVFIIAAHEDENGSLSMRVMNDEKYEEYQNAQDAQQQEEQAAPQEQPAPAENAVDEAENKPDSANELTQEPAAPAENADEPQEEARKPENEPEEEPTQEPNNEPEEEPTQEPVNEPEEEEITQEPEQEPVQEPSAQDEPEADEDGTPAKENKDNKEDKGNNRQQEAEAQTPAQQEAPQAEKAEKAADAPAEPAADAPVPVYTYTFAGLNSQATLQEILEANGITPAQDVRVSISDAHLVTLTAAGSPLADGKAFDYLLTAIDFFTDGAVLSLLGETRIDVILLNPAPEAAEEETEEGQAAENAESGEAHAAVDLNDLAVSFGVTWEDAQPGFGSLAHFDAVLDGFEGLDYSIQWQYSPDSAEWHDVDNATGPRMDQVITEENYLYYWRVMVYIDVSAEG